MTLAYDMIDMKELGRQVSYLLTGMEKMIPIISDIQDIIRRSQANFEIDLPSIAVVGSQSTGKSALLQSIIGKELLPKGKGIVTRRPIEIQLCQINGEKEYAEFVDRKGEHYENLEQFKKAIEVQTDRMCGGNKGISNIPLRVRYCSKRVLDLMLVDLPGIVKNPTGDQPKDIEDQVTRMIKSYIKNPNCIIIAVSKATDDSANSESLKIARQADKEGIRTIGVLTHIDLVDENTNILKEYNTLTSKLQLGHTCVFLRPSKTCFSIEEQFKKEEEFFHRHENYSAAAEKMGVRALVRTLNMLLVKHIKQELPSIRQALVSVSQNKKTRMSEYGEYEATTDKKAQGIIVLALVNKYVKCFVEMIEGKYTDTREAIIGGARIQYIFSQIFVRSVNRLDPFEHLTDNDIRTAIRNANGLKKSLFLPEAAFQSLVKTQIMRLKYPSLQCAHLIHEELRRLIYLIKVPQIERYEILSKKMFIVMENLLSKSLQRTEEMIRSLIEIEVGYINTNHPDFIDVISLVKSNPQSKYKQKEGGLSSFEYENGNEVSDDQEEKKVANNNSNKFNKKQPNQLKNQIGERSQILDARLENIKNVNEKNKMKRAERIVPLKTASKDLESLYNEFNDPNPLPRYELPSVPSLVRVNDRPKAREITETEMIKRLITSYFNVVKKNINDSIPKTIVTFLVNNCRNCCEKILVNNVYVEEEFEKLLHEQDHVVMEREKLQKDIQTLKECLQSVNDLESQLSY